MFMCGGGCALHHTRVWCYTIPGYIPFSIRISPYPIPIPYPGAGVYECMRVYGIWGMWNIQVLQGYTRMASYIICMRWRKVHIYKYNKRINKENNKRNTVSTFNTQLTPTPTLVIKAILIV